MRCVALLLTAALLPRIAAAQEQRQPLQELFLTENVYPQERGEFQVTLGALVDRSRSDFAALAPFRIEYGLTKRWQIEAGWDGYAQFKERPLDRVRTARYSVGTKYSFLNIAHSGVHAALGIDVEFPRSAALPENEGEEGTEFEPFAGVAIDLGRGLTLFGSGGASLEPHAVADLVTHGQRPDDRGTASIGALLAVRYATLVAEYVARSDLPWRLNGAPLLMPSIVIHPAKWEFAVGVPVSVRSRQRRPGFALHVIKDF